MAKNDTIGTMAQRPRLSVDVSPELLFMLSALVGEHSVKEQRKVTQREIVLLALKRAYPQLSKQIDADLAQP